MSASIVAECSKVISTGITLNFVQTLAKCDSYNDFLDYIALASRHNLPVWYISHSEANFENAKNNQTLEKIIHKSHKYE